MVELSRGAAITVGAGGGTVVLVLVALLVRSSRRWRAASRRLASTATRLELPGHPAADDRDAVGRVERHAQAVVLRLSDEEACAERPAGALAHVGLGVVVCDEHGGVAYRNALAPHVGGDGSDPAGGPCAGGQVLVASTEGKGSTFTLRLPFREGDAAVPAASGAVR